MYKKLLLMATLSVFTGAAFSQTTLRAEKALTDPKRVQNETQADVFVQPKNKAPHYKQSGALTDVKAMHKKRNFKHKLHA